MILRYNFNPFYIISNVVYFDNYRKRVHITRPCWNELYTKLILRCVRPESRKEKVVILKKIIGIAYKKYVLQNKQDEAITFFNNHMLEEFGEVDDLDKVVESSSEMNVDVEIEDENSFSEDYVGGESVKKEEMSLELYSRINNYSVVQNEIENEINIGLNAFLVTSELNHKLLNSCGYSKIRNMLLNFLNFGSFIPRNEGEKLFIKTFLKSGFLYSIRKIYQKSITDCDVCNNDKECITCERYIQHRCSSCQYIVNQTCHEQCPFNMNHPHGITSHPNFESSFMVKKVTDFSLGSRFKNLSHVQETKFNLKPYVKFKDCDECIKLKPFNDNTGCNNCFENGKCDLCVHNFPCSLHNNSFYLCNCGALYLNSNGCTVYGCTSNLQSYGPYRRSLTAKSLVNHNEMISTRRYVTTQYALDRQITF